MTAAALLAAATLLLGFAHRPPGADAPARAVALAALVLPDGTATDLCHAGSDGDAVPSHDGHAYAACDACRLADAPGLAAIEAIALAAPPAIVLARLGHATTALAGSRRPIPVSRGPPLAA